MSKITIKTTGDARWDAISADLANEKGEITATEKRDGETYYNANFPKNGSLVVGIPASVCTLSE